MSFTLHLSSFTCKQLYRRLQQAYGSGALRVVRRIQGLLAFADNQSVQEVAKMLTLGQPTIRDSRNAFLLQGVSSLGYTRPPGRPSTFTPSQRRELAALIKAGPQGAGYTSGCWNTPMIQDLVQSRFGTSYHPLPLLGVVLAAPTVFQGGDESLQVCQGRRVADRPSPRRLGDVPAPCDSILGSSPHNTPCAAVVRVRCGHSLQAPPTGGYLAGVADLHLDPDIRARLEQCIAREVTRPTGA